MGIMEKKEKMNKKAGVPDGLFYMVAIFAVAIISVVGYMVLSNINDNFQTSNGISSEGKVLTQQIKDKYVGIIDNSFLIILVGILIGTVAGVWFIRTHPALFWIMIPIFAFIIFFAAIYGNVFYNFTTNAKIAPTAADFTIIPFIMNNYVKVITGVVILIAIFLFSKGKSEQQ